MSLSPQVPPDPSAVLLREGAPPVPVTGNCSLGRAVGNDVVLVDERVSRRHATIHRQGEHEWWLVDLGSRNGTYLNGRRVGQPTRLHDGDRIQVGPFTLRFLGGSRREASLSSSGPADQTQADLRSVPCWLLVADIAGSTALARSVTPEELSVLVGGWFAHCKEAVEENGGTINKYLGDGWLAYWLASENSLPHVVQALRDLTGLQERGRPRFRLVVHRGPVLMGGIPSTGEENLAGNEVNLVFRQEKLAGQLNLERVASASAAEPLRTFLPLDPVGEHELPGFPGRHPFFRF